MTTLEWLSREIRDDLRVTLHLDLDTEEAWLGEALAVALAEVGLSDRAIELIMEVAPERQGADSERQSLVLAEDPAISARRVALGISVAEAARDLDIADTAYEVIERSPLRWQNVETARAAAYLAKLGIKPAAFVRWLASLLPTGQRFAWGYRPGAVANLPLQSETLVADRELLVEWGRAVLAVAPPSFEDPDVDELLGRRWSIRTLAGRVTEIAEAARQRILSIPMQTDVGDNVETETLIGLPFAGRIVFPAFQFGEDGAPLHIVTEINGLLGAKGDPWGVTEWWLAHDESLGTRPVELIHGDESARDQLRRSVRAILEAD